MNNLLILVIFLAPIVNGLEMGNCHSQKVNESQISRVICHENQQEIDNSICINHCCQNCQCDGLMIAVVLFNSSADDTVQFHHYEYKIDYVVFVPFQEPHPLFRPPIV